MAAPPVTLSIQPGCVDSDQVRQLLRRYRIPFVERDVGRDADAAAELERTDIFATPVLNVGERSVFGFRPAMIEVVLTETGRWPPG